MARGCGWQHLAAMTNLVAFYFIGMPLAMLFAFKLNFYTTVINYPIKSSRPCHCGMWDSKQLKLHSEI